MNIIKICLCINVYWVDKMTVELMLTIGPFHKLFCANSGCDAHLWSYIYKFDIIILQ